MFAGCVWAFKVAIAPPVTDAINHACSKQRNPHHLDSPDGLKPSAPNREMLMIASAVMPPVVYFS